MNATSAHEIMAISNVNFGNNKDSLLKNLLMPAWLRLAFPQDKNLERLQIMQDSSSSSWFFFLDLAEGSKLSALWNELTQDPASLFHTLLVSIVSVTVFVRLWQAQSRWSSSTPTKNEKEDVNINTNAQQHDDADINSSAKHATNQSQELRWLQWKFLSVFWLLRISFWMSGPYFYAAYALKTNNNTQLISQISLVGYAAIAVFGPFLGTFSDRYGRKCGTLLATLLYGLGSWSTLASSLGWLFLGRALGGVGTSLMSAAPEAWLVSEFNRLQQQHQASSSQDLHTNHTGVSPTKTEGSDGTVKRQSQINRKSPMLNPSFLQQTFGIAYAYDSVCAIGAGQLAGLAANKAGPTGPFQMSPIFLACGALLSTFLWNENKAICNSTVTLAMTKTDNKNTVSVEGKESCSQHATNDDSSQSSNSSEETSRDDTQKKPPRQPHHSNSKPLTVSNKKEAQSIWDAVNVIRSDTRIAYLGGVQAFFEGAMYIFVMQWPPTMNRAIQEAYGASAATPYGTAFSCFMACCMAGSTVFGMLSKSKSSAKSTTLSTSTSLLSSSLEGRTVLLLGLSFLSIVAATVAVATPTVAGTGRRLWQLVVSFFVFEACVGMYFPSIGTLRSKYLPDSHRSVIMTLFGVPLNVIVVTVFLLVHKLGNVGALGVASVVLGLATGCMVGLYIAERRSRKKKQARDRFKKAVRQVQIMKDLSDHFRAELAKQRNEFSIMEAVKENRKNFCTFSGPQFF